MYFVCVKIFFHSISQQSYNWSIRWCIWMNARLTINGVQAKIKEHYPHAGYVLCCVGRICKSYPFTTITSRISGVGLWMSWIKITKLCWITDEIRNFVLTTSCVGSLTLRLNLMDDDFIFCLSFFTGYVTWKFCIRGLYDKYSC